jgi:hypothetical protein
MQQAVREQKSRFLQQRGVVLASLSFGSLQ